MKVCPKCGTQHDKSGIYCSRKCANSRSFSAESNKKRSDTVKKYWSTLSEEDREKKNEIYKELGYNSAKKHAENVMTQDWLVLGIQGKRLRVILEQDGKCNKCGITHWNGERITLEYEHIDGNNENNSRENVEALCPNCHSQTKTWRGRKNGKTQKKIEGYIALIV